MCHMICLYKTNDTEHKRGREMEGERQVQRQGTVANQDHPYVLYSTVYDELNLNKDLNTWSIRSVPDTSKTNQADTHFRTSQKVLMCRNVRCGDPLNQLMTYSSS